MSMAKILVMNLTSQKGQLKVWKQNWVSKHCHISILHMLLTLYSQIPLRRIGSLRSMCSSGAPLGLNTLTTAASMSLNVQPPTAKGSMAGMCAIFLILVMQGPPVVCVDMQKCAGATRQSALLTTPKIWKAHAPSVTAGSEATADSVV